MTPAPSNSSNPVGSMGFSASRRIKRQLDFAAVFERGKVAADDVLVMHAIRTEAKPSKIGLSVSKKVGHAPLRNRWKRLMREAFRRNAAQLPSHLWLVVRPRRGAAPNYRAIEQSLLRLARKLERKL